MLHWHAIDAHSFPVQSLSYPKLWEGAWAPDQRYTVADMQTVVEYARQRGVRVMLEIDGKRCGPDQCRAYFLRRSLIGISNHRSRARLFLGRWLSRPIASGLERKQGQFKSPVLIYFRGETINVVSLSEHWCSNAQTSVRLKLWHLAMCLWTHRLISRFKCWMLCLATWLAHTPAMVSSPRHSCILVETRFVFVAYFAFCFVKHAR